MYLPRFYVPDSLCLEQKTYCLPKNCAHHALRVLRLELNHQVLLFNGMGGEFLAQITQTQPHVEVTLLKFIDICTESPLHTILIQGLCQTDKMDWIVQKAVELGITEIYPVACERSVTKLDDKKAQKRFEHWQNIIIAASEQSRRTKVTILHPVIRFSQLVTHFTKIIPTYSHFFCDPDGQKSLQSFTFEPDQILHPIALWIGPEGG